MKHLCLIVFIITCSFQGQLLAHPAEKVVGELTTTVMDVVESSNKSNYLQRIRKSFDNGLSDHIEIETISRFLIGRGVYKSANKDQQFVVRREIQLFLIGALSTALFETADYNRKSLPFKGKDGDKAVSVNTLYEDPASGKK